MRAIGKLNIIQPLPDLRKTHISIALR